MIGRMARVEHILLESDERDVPTLETARRIHARISLPGGSWRPSLELALIDYFYLSVRTTRARSAGSRYVVDLRFVDPAPGLSRRLPWSWIAAGAVFLALGNSRRARNSRVDGALVAPRVAPGHGRIFCSRRPVRCHWPSSGLRKR